ncbi:hypothetical protein [Endozoicomonas euniceicola]|uniref:Uncharacterized protein n=1 Tax=Endozoicomonas euniceicola TaxID=1234143 RepID=A0ABY6H0E9_9GAMM|nr:hypothetical protein [Endozoicomonas euniceicola]UYM18302.1 hypothetical protein NX720_10465 [Endozoicomonas euniceicola]
MDKIPKPVLPALSIDPVESDDRKNPSKGSGIVTVDTGQTLLGNTSQAGTSNERVSIKKGRLLSVVMMKLRKIGRSK